MGRQSKTRNPTKETYRPIDPAVREQQMIGFAVDLAEQKLRDGTASSQIIEHYLKLGSTRASLERELLEQDLLLKKARTESIESEKRIEEKYIEAINAMRRYNGIRDEEDE